MNSFKTIVKRGFQSLNSNITYKSLFLKANYTCVTYAMYTKKLISSPKPIEEKSNELMGRLGNADLKEIINFLWHSQERGHWSSELSQKSEERIVGRYDELSEFDLSMVAWVYGNGRTGSKDFWFGLEREALQRISEGKLTRTNFGRLINGFAEANNGSEVFWTRVQKFIEDGIDDFNAEAIAHSLNAMGKVVLNGHEPHKLTIEALKHGVLRNYIDLYPAELALTLQGLADLQIDDQKVWNAVSRVFIQVVPTSSPEVLALGVENLARADKGSVKTWREINEHVLHGIENFKPTELASIAWAAAKVQYENDTFWNAIVKSVSSQLKNQEPSVVAKLIFALTSSTFPAENFVKESFGLVNNSNSIKKLGAQGFSYLLWVLEKNTSLPRESVNEINKLIIEKAKTWTRREKEEFLLTLTGTQILSNDVRKAVESSI